MGRSSKSSSQSSATTTSTTSNTTTNIATNNLASDVNGDDNVTLTGVNSTFNIETLDDEVIERAFQFAESSQLVTRESFSEALGLVTESAANAVDVIEEASRDPNVDLFKNLIYLAAAGVVLYFAPPAIRSLRGLL
jgi:hypothetical protein